VAGHHRVKEKSVNLLCQDRFLKEENMTSKETICAYEEVRRGRGRRKRDIRGGGGRRRSLLLNYNGDNKFLF
jgi:hypothetical protein